MNEEKGVNRIKDDEITRFLLHELGEPEREAFEERLFAETPLFEEVEAVQQELIDDYLDGTLPAERSRRFEAVFRATPELWSRVEFSRQLRERLRVEPPARHAIVEPRPGFLSRWFSGWVPALAASAAGVLLFAVGANLISTRRDLDETRRQVAALRQSNAELEQRIAQRPPEQPAAQVQPPVQKLVEMVYAFALAQGTSRGAADVRPLAIPRNAAQVMLQLELDAPSAYPTYQAVLETPEGRALARQDGLAPDGGSIALRIPAARLPAGDFVVRVSGVKPGSAPESVTEYSFRVSRR